METAIMTTSIFIHHNKEMLLLMTLKFTIAGDLVYNKNNPEVNNDKERWDGTSNGVPLLLGV